MSISNRQLELSQALIQLQAQYNSMRDENKKLREELNTAKSDIQYFKQLNEELRSHLDEATRRIKGLLASVSVSKSNQKPQPRSDSKAKKSSLK
jgi:chromosome segregation ATPase